MTIRENKFPVQNFITPKHVLLSVFDKTGLDFLVDGLLRCNPHVHFYSTGGTGKRVVEILGDKAGTHYTSVEAFINTPEMEGGLVKTLHPKIHAGLLAERNNPEHIRYLEQTMLQMTGSPGVFFDVMVGNLYPFSATIAGPDATPEQARVNIDIGGPTMIMAAAKNWSSVAVLTDPQQYLLHFLSSVEADCGGRISLDLRFSLASAALQLIGDYRKQIGHYFSSLSFERDVKPFLNIEGTQA